VERFANDDSGYLNWLKANPDGFVINVTRRRAAHLVLHRATCSTIGGAPARGSHRTTDSAKFCGDRNELEALARSNSGGQPRACRLCLGGSAAGRLAAAPPRHAHRWSELISGIIAGILSGAAVSFFLTPTGQATEIFVAHGDPKPSCANPQWLLQVPDAEVSANSYYFTFDTIPHYGILHPPESSVDGAPRSAWLQWWPTTKINKEKDLDVISWTFPRQFDVRLVCIVDGWAEDQDTYNRTLPIRTATLSSVLSPCPTVTKGITSISTYNPTRWQQVPFSCYAQEVSLRIDTVLWPSGKARDKLDLVPEPAPHAKIRRPLTGLSEVRFYYSPDYLRYMPLGRPAIAWP
jgi:hypothetical protein